MTGMRPRWIPACVGLVALALASRDASAADEADRVRPDEDLGVYPPPRERSVGLGLTLAPVAAQEVASKVTTPEGRPEFDYFLGGRASASLHFSVGQRSEIVAGIYAAPSQSATAPGTLTPLGARVEARYDLVPPVFTGLALNAGYLIAPNEQPTDQFVYEPVSSLFYAPELIPIGVRLGENEEVELGLGVSVLFSQQNDTLGALFSTSYFTQTLWAGYVLPL